jgi:hypothetical protein
VAAFEREVAALAAAGGFTADLTAGFADVLGAALGAAGVALTAALGAAGVALTAAGTALTAALGAAGAALPAVLAAAGAAIADAAVAGFAPPGLKAF